MTSGWNWLECSPTARAWTSRFRNASVLDVAKLGQFDLVLCIAVMTEVSDFFGVLAALKSVIGSYAFLELDLARPMLFLSWPRARKPMVGPIPTKRALAFARPNGATSS